MTSTVILAMAVAAIAVILLLARNATLLFEARVQRGKVVYLRGRAPKRLVREWTDVLSVRPVSKAILRVRSSGDAAELSVEGDVNAGESQRLRNVLGLFSLAQIRSEPYRKVS